MFINQSKNSRNSAAYLILLVVLILGLVACQSVEEPPPAEPQSTETSSDAAAEATEPAAAEEEVTEAIEEVAPTEEAATEAVEEAPTASGDIPAAFADPNQKPRVALVREIGEGGFMERYLAGAQSMADELGLELIETNARGDQAKMVTMIENAIQQNVDAIIVDHGRTDTLQPAIEEALDKGIKVVAFDLVIDNPNVPEIEQDDMLIGFMLSKKMATDFGGDANVTYINVGGFAPLTKRDRAWQNFKWRYEGLNEVAHSGAGTDNTGADTLTGM